MKVKELIELLEKEDQDLEVCLCDDDGDWVPSDSIESIGAVARGTYGCTWYTRRDSSPSVRIVAIN